MKAQPALLDQFLIRRCGGPLYGRGDASAGLGDFLVARSRAAHRMLVGARSAEHQMCVAIDQAGSDPCAAERIDLARAEARELRALADADDPAVGDAYRTVLDHPERIAGTLFESGDVAVDEQPVPHDLA